MRPVMQRFQLLSHRLAQTPVEARHRLVEQQQLGLDHQRARQCHTLLLAARQRPWATIAERQSESDALEHRFGPALALRSGDATCDEAERDVLACRHVREKREALEHHADVAGLERQRCHVDAADSNRSGTRGQVAADQTEQCGLSAARRPEQAQ